MSSAPAERQQGTLNLEWPCEYWRHRIDLGYGSFSAWCQTTSCQFPRMRGYDCGNCKNAKPAYDGPLCDDD